jgi:hypothetical protein
MTQAPSLPAKKAAKPRELMLWLGVLTMAVAPIVLGVMMSYEQQLSALAEKGVVTEGVVKSKDIQSSSYTGHRGKPRSSTTYLVNFAYDFNASTPYAEWKSTGAIRPSAYPAPTTGDFEVGSDWYDKLQPGQTEMLIWQRGKYGEGMVVSEMEHRMSFAFMWSWYLGLGAAFIAGLWMTYAGWQKKRAHAAH